MSWYPNEAWRDGYDAWKLATPPYYQCEPEDNEPPPTFIDCELIDEFDFEECFGVTP